MEGVQALAIGAGLNETEAAFFVAASVGTFCWEEVG